MVIHFCENITVKALNERTRDVFEFTIVRHNVELESKT